MRTIHRHVKVSGVLLLFFLWSCATWSPSVEGETLFRMRDPLGDDVGDGGITYPRDATFHPYKGLLDLVEFAMVGEEGFVRFDLVMKKVQNPWNAPEGFYHPRIDIFIYTGDQGGRTTPLREGAGVQFSPRYPWNYWLRVAPFGGTALF